jgi:hypothetical protein
MKDSGRLHVFALMGGHEPVHQYIDGLPASLVVGTDPSAPTPITVHEPLRFDAITLFPAYYLQRQIEDRDPKVTLARGVALHRVAREDERHCTGYVGLGAQEEERAFLHDGSQILGRWKPDLELGYLRFPCDALGGRLEQQPILEASVARVQDDERDEGRALRFAPERDEGGAFHYEATEFGISEEAGENTFTFWIRATAEGARQLASASVTLLEQGPDSKKIRLVIDSAIAVEG